MVEEQRCRWVLVDIILNFDVAAQVDKLLEKDVDYEGVWVAVICLWGGRMMYLWRERAL